MDCLDLKMLATGNMAAGETLFVDDSVKNIQAAEEVVKAANFASIG